jgi:hypothetical protein
VPSHGFDERPELHGAALGVGERLVEEVGGDGREQGQVPAADGGEDVECGLGVEGGVAVRPAVLVEGLDDVVRLGEGLAEAEGEDDFGVGEVA